MKLILAAGILALALSVAHAQAPSQAGVETAIVDMFRIIADKNNTIADLQKQLAEAKKPPPETPK